MTEPTRSGRRVRPRTLWLSAAAVAVVIAVSSISLSLTGGTSPGKAIPPTSSPTGPTKGPHLDSAVELTGSHAGVETTGGSDESGDLLLGAGVQSPALAAAGRIVVHQRARLPF